MKRLSILVSSIVAVFAVTSTAAYAAAAPTPAAGKATTTGIAISPAIQQFVLSPKQTSFSFNVQLYNHTDQATNLTLSTADFTSLNATGGVAFLGSSVSDVQKQHELGSFLQIGSKTVTLAPNASVQVPVTITNANKLALGGHYAAILATASPAPGAGGGNRVTLNQVVSSLVFVETAGQGTKSLTLLKPNIDKVAFSLPSSVDLYFKATGNTQTVPRGLLTLSKGDAPALVQGPINVDSSLLLPGSTRLISTLVSGNRHPLWPGVYHLSVQYRYDGSLGISTYQTSFFYINILFLLIAIIIVVAILVLLYKTRRQLRRLPGFMRRRTRSFQPATSVATPIKTLPPASTPVPDVQKKAITIEDTGPEEILDEQEVVVISVVSDDQSEKVPEAPKLEESEAPNIEPTTETKEAKVVTKRTITVALADDETVEPKSVKKVPKKTSGTKKSATKPKVKKSKKS